ncbi:MAG: helix-turn-helix domain-containing protein [Paracoccaceae bacterium]
MPALPIPLIVALLLAAFGLRAALRGETPWPLLWLIALCALQSAIVAGRLHYGIDSLSFIQPVLALAVPPLAWVAFISATARPLGQQDLWHLTPVALGVLLRLVAPWVLDPTIIATFLIYGAAILQTLRHAPEIVHARLGAGERPLRLWRWVGISLVLSALSDVAILALVVAGYQQWIGWLVTGFSTLFLAAIGALMLTEDVASVAEPEDTPRAATAEDAALFAQLEAMMAERALWRDPDLTLARVARRMGVPAKALSAAVNRVRGENISRVINGWRIAHAAERLRSGVAVTEAMLDAGFNTKSNFNREFLRVMGQAPTDWLKANKAE